MPLALLVSIVAYRWISSQLSKFANTKIENKLRENFKSAIIEKVASLKYNYIEDQSCWDLIARIKKEPEKQCSEVYTDKINDKYHEQYEKARKVLLKTRAKWFFISKLGGMIFTLLSVFIIAVLLNPVSKHIISIGLFTSLVNSLLIFQKKYMLYKMV